MLMKNINNFAFFIRENYRNYIFGEQLFTDK